MRSAEVRRRCLARLTALAEAGLEVPSPFDAAELVARVSRCLGRTIRLVAVSMPASAPYGLTLFTTDGGHIIAYEERATRIHRDHIIGHELAHLLLGHRPLEISDPDAVRLLFPTLPPRLVHQVLNRSGTYGREEELEAETMATLLIERAGIPLDDVDARDLAPEDADVVTRLSESFEQPR